MKKVFPPLFLVVIIVARYHTILGGFWMFDDTAILKFAVSYRPWEYFFVPSVWQQGTVSNFTPWIVFSFDLDWKLFGLNPWGFYLHHLASLCVLAVTVYLVLRLWFSRTVSFLGAVCFVVSPPFAGSARMLMERHYIEGLVFALLSVYCFERGTRSANTAWSLPGALFYLLACAAKEIYVPLVGLLSFIPGVSLRARLRHLAPWLGAAALYVVWRWYMLGHLLGGYGYELPASAVLSLPLRIADAMGGMSRVISWWRWLVWASLGGALAVLAKHDRKAFLTVLVVSPLVLLPIVPVSPLMQPRYVWLFTFCWMAVHLPAWQNLNDRTGRTLSVAPLVWSGVLFSCLLFLSLTNLALTREGMHRQAAEGKFVLREGNQTDLLAYPVAPGWYYEGLFWLRESVLHLPAGPSVTSDPLPLCLDRTSRIRQGPPKDLPATIWRFDAGEGRLVSEDAVAFCAAELGKKVIRQEAPLSIEALYRDSVFSWKFGPWDRGDYALLLGEKGQTVFPLSSGGKRFISLRGQTLFLRLRYLSPEGWLTYSPLLSLKVNGDEGTVIWQR